MSITEEGVAFGEPLVANHEARFSLLAASISQPRTERIELIAFTSWLQHALATALAGCPSRSATAGYKPRWKRTLTNCVRQAVLTCRHDSWYTWYTFLLFLFKEEVGMAITQNELDSFHQFASDRLGSVGSELSWPELIDLWRIENPAADQQAEIYAALDESLEDIDSGRHRPAESVLRDLRRKHNLSE